uniref:CSON001797 protein n=1 Tax=Culicoides sonorensis TaxID=179676 RepID=A0A336MLG6_CULSO
MVKTKFLSRNCNQPQRCVPAFTIQCNQKNTFVLPPPKVDIFRPKQCCSLFRKYFLRGDIPCGKSFDKKISNGRYLYWKVPPEELDLSVYLPLFFEGTYFAFHILNCVPQLILPTKKALNTKNPCCLIPTMRALQQLVMSGPCIGQALVPYYRQILPILNLFRDCNVSIGDEVDFHQQIGDVIDETLHVLECHGGPDAYINIKLMIPTYESYVFN